jgi:hypothetical protein
MNKEQVECRKCKENHYCDEHHILPKALFGEGETDSLCKNCHDEFHRTLGHEYLRKENKQSMEFYLKKYFSWLVGLCIAVALFLLIYNS